MPVPQAGHQRPDLNPRPSSGFQPTLYFLTSTLHLSTSPLLHLSTFPLLPVPPGRYLFPVRLVLAVLLVLFPAAASAQDLTIRGRVTAAADNSPLFRARLVVTADGRSSAPVYADDAGAFELPIPQSGSYRIAVSKAGYAPLAIAGTRDTSRPIVLAMARGAVIRGRVTDTAGDAIVGTTVALRAVDGSRTAPLAGITVDTDDRGEFRFGNLPAGRYEVQSYRPMGGTAAFANMPPEMAQRMSLELQETRRRMGALVSADAVASAGEEVAVTLVQSERAVSLPYARVGGVITGVLTDEFGEPLEGAAVRLWQTRFVDGRQSIFPAGLQRTIDDTGRFRLFHIPAGRYLLTATPALDLPDLDPALPAYLPVYFPGRFDVSSASPIHVDAASETPGIDMVVARSFGARVFGVALSSAGTPLRGEVRLVPSQTTGPVQLAPTYLRNGLTPNALVARPDADGRFEIVGVAPGLYAVQAAATIQSSEPMRVSDTIAGVPREQQVLMMLHNEGITEFTVQRHAITEGAFGPLTLATLPTATLRGTVTVDGPRQRITPSEFSFTVAHADPDEVPAMVGIRPDIVLLPTGKFEVSGLSGRARIMMTRGPAGWWLKSVDIGGTNAADVPVNFDSPAASRDDVTMVLAATGATLSGRVTDVPPERGASVVIFPVERDKRLSGSRYVRSTSVGSEATFSLNSFPPGQYYVVAVEEADGDSTGDWENPDQLDALAPIAQRVTLSEGGTHSLELAARIAPR